ncbi:MAG: hypothetical protein EOQ39_18855 [Mesorhizobium sp.]|uniref:hypothetical protein n=1 Tax=Mesorhizobium sp. TaxID=1871066 RepID=UPI000FE9AAEA|nr:hypothetical protein [Mesorhizobium sp.]RWB08768.1 MAG: hypothetical protein EOQ37_04485 [Mesorhizobium sp.]RWB13581.1 MAG: hypothetical protein EOQ39_18855 [Mesorhizobium sp.]
MSTRHKGIIAYGTEEDRLKLAVLAQLTGKSGSEVVIQMIREKYRAVLGDADPERVTMHR